MATLEYPFPEPPEHGLTLEIAPGLLWVRMPLPMALDHINLYLLDDGDGWWLIDTGIGGRTTRDWWARLFADHLDGKPVKAVLVTHMHPDHVGQAAWICERWRAPLYMSFGEYYSARTYSALEPGQLDWHCEQFYHRAGLDADAVERLRAGFGGFGAVIDGVPGAFTRLSHGDGVAIGKDHWEVIVGRGHSPEHVCLWCPERKLLLAGDQIIPRITPNISVVALEPEANPLREWFDSLQHFRTLPADTFVCPAHNTPFRGLHARIDYLIDHHRDHLEALMEACEESRTALELLPVLFDRPLDGTQLTLALGECIAHLNWLVTEGRMRRSLGDNGLYRYRSLEAVESHRPHHLDPPPQQV